MGRSSANSIAGVVGTDTEVGKTIVAAALARALAGRGLRVGVYKPFAADPARRRTGEGFSTDADLLARAAGMKGGAAAACGQLFRAPLAPLEAARLEGRRVELGAALRGARRVAAHHDLTLVEGCGGWEVPLTPRKTTADFFAALGAPVVVVARAGLGTINHTLLTLAAIERRGLRVVGVILNRTRGGAMTRAERTNPEIIRRFGRVDVWGPVPFKRNLNGRRADRIKPSDLPRLDAVAEAILQRIER